MFHYRDGMVPTTPEPESQPEDLQPPPPPRQVLKVRRRRTTMVQPQEDLHLMDQIPIPTIEAPQLHSDASTELPTMYAPMQDDAFLSPGFGFPRMVSPPKTPSAQIRIIDFDGVQPWSDIRENHRESFSRPTSSSGFSDSSISSRGSMDSYVSRGGSCTSPEEEMTDPFLAFSPDIKDGQLTSPTFGYQQAHQAKRLKLRPTFTEEMDHHLWMTYMKYLQDPTVTPFKALPSTTPPNGVCHRVARMARKTWKGPRSSRLGLRIGSQFGSRSGTPDTIRALKSGSNTPVPMSSGASSRFPSEKQCRKRLRDLAKQKPSLSAHYQRLLRRSPSPFQSSPPSEKESQSQSISSLYTEGPIPASFSTRDMGVSLATSTAPSMQTGNPLSQLSKDITPRPATRAWSSMRSSAHQKSKSLHIGLGLGLGSSFQAMSHLTDVSMHQPNARTWHAHSSSQPPRLGSPFQLHAPRPISRVFKRRALNSSFEDRARNRGNSFVDDLFGAPAESSHRRVRSRGFSLGDTMEGSRRLPLSNAASSLTDPFVTQPQTQNAPHSSAAGQGQATIRLGSPFGSRPSNTFPRSSLSHSFEPPASFEQRFAAMPSDPAFLHRS